MTELKTMTIAGNSITFDDQGRFDRPVVVMLAGWCQDHRAFNRLVPLLRDDHRVVRIDWRGHGVDRSPVADFGVAEQADDVIVVLDALSIERFSMISHSHGGWPLLEIADRLGPDRVTAGLLLDLIMVSAPPELSAALAVGQDPVHWRSSQTALVDVWLKDSANEHVREHIEYESGGYGFAMWERCCRVIADSYERWRSPMGRMVAMREHPPLRHLFSQPEPGTYDEVHDAFAAQHPWFSFARIGGETHFPSLDSPERVAAEIRDLLGVATAGSPGH